MKLRETIPGHSPEPEVFAVTCRWSSPKATLFTEKQEALDYARDRLRKLLNHKTAGPKVNGKKVPPVVKELQGENKHQLLWVEVGATLADGCYWHFGGTFTIQVTHVKHNGEVTTNFC